MRTVLEALKIVNNVTRNAIGMDLRAIKRARAMRIELDEERRELNRRLFDLSTRETIRPTHVRECLQKQMDLQVQGAIRVKMIVDINGMNCTAKERAALVESVRGIFSSSVASIAFELSPTTGNAIDDILAVCDLFDAAADITINDIMAEISADIFSEA